MRNGVIEIGDTQFSTLIACNHEEHRKGLMFKPAPAPIMTFPYFMPSINKFWMKNCCAPLDIVFCKDGKVISIYDGIPYSTAAVGPEIPTDLVIELPHGTMDKARLGVGAPIRLTAELDTTENAEEIYPNRLQSLLKVLQ